MWQEIKEAIADFFDDLGEWFYDVFVTILEALLNGIGTLIEAIALPDFFLTYSLADYVHPDVGYFLAASGFDNALAIVGLAYVFRIIRRIVTLRIW